VLKPIIVTFYSFKGGVGRSMALLNTAWLLAQARRRVLMIDFDLEAPGLTWLVRRTQGDEIAADNSKGMIDLLHEYVTSPETWAFHPDRSEPDLNSFLTEVPSGLRQEGGSLHLMTTAGKLDTYGENLAAVAMKSRAFRKVRKAFAMRFREVLIDCERFDYIFVDARTGMSDESYIACKFLCDYLIVFSGLNQQNIEGTGLFLKKVGEWRSRQEGPAKVALIASPVCEYEDDVKNRRVAEATERLTELTGIELQFTDALPYHPRLSLYEELVALQWPESGLGRAYLRLYELIRSLASDRFSDWTGRLWEAMQARDIARGSDVLRELESIDRYQAVELIRQLSVNWGEGSDQETRYFLDLFPLLSELDPNEPLHPLQAFRRARRLGRPRDEVEMHLRVAREISERIGNQTDLAFVAFGEGETAFLYGNYDTALRASEEALAIYRELGRKDSIADSLSLLAEVHRKRGDYDAAQRGLEEALAICRELGRKDGVAGVLSLLAEIRRLRGDYDAARRGFEESLAIYRDLGRPREMTIASVRLEGTLAMTNDVYPLERFTVNADKLIADPDPSIGVSCQLLVGDTLIHRGQPLKALEYLNRALSTSEHYGYRGLAAEAQAVRARCLAALERLDEAAQAASAALMFFEEQKVRYRDAKFLKSLLRGKRAE